MTLFDKHVWYRESLFYEANLVADSEDWKITRPRTGRHGEAIRLMALTLEKALDFLREHDFHLYHAKSWNESLLIHSFTAYSLVHHVLPFTQLYTEKDKELMRWAATDSNSGSLVKTVASRRWAVATQKASA